MTKDVQIAVTPKSTLESLSISLLPDIAVDFFNQHDLAYDAFENSPASVTNSKAEADRKAGIALDHAERFLEAASARAWVSKKDMTAKARLALQWCRNDCMDQAGTGLLLSLAENVARAENLR